MAIELATGMLWQGEWYGKDQEVELHLP